jgi:hypothetical protein
MANWPAGGFGGGGGLCRRAEGEEAPRQLLAAAVRARVRRIWADAIMRRRAEERDKPAALASARPLPLVACGLMRGQNQLMELP